MLVLFNGSVRNLISPLIFFFYEFFKSVTIHPGAFWYSGMNYDTLKKTAKKGKSEHMI